MLKKLFTNTLFFGLAPYASKIISVFLLPVMTQYLTATDYGIAGTIDAYTQGLTALSTLGFTTVLSVIFFRSKFQYKILWREIYGFLQYWMVLFALLQGIILYFIIPEEAADNKWWIILLTNFSNVFFGATAIIGNSYYVLNMKALPVVIRTMIAGIVTVFANYLLVVHFRLGYLGWYVGSFIGTFIMNASYWYTVNIQLKLTPIMNFKRRTIFKYLKVSLPTVPHYYTSFLMNASSKVVMNAYSCPINTLGQANIVLQIGGLLDSWIAAINQAINPMTLTEIRERNELKARSLIYIYLGLTYVCTFLFAVWSKEIFSLLISNAELAATYPYIILFVMALNYRPMYVAVTNIFFYYENTTTLLKVTFISGLIALGLYCLLIPFYSIWGVMVGYYIAAIYMGYSGFFTRFFRSKSKVEYPFKVILLLHVTLTIVAYVIVECPVPVKLLVSLLFAVSVLWIIKKQKK
ncbi:lipopolysaccharide biosynthesis protein [Bacteroides fluxus]|uniref:Polysaccharide biosynthesis protein n=1 Tax=Bacteroides fluxus YIT 12057 TaxID=763034 RepID=F3PUQ6_9BACE|nr:polysaccharide biosynthesis protein [Bacteroides fluxus]EGF55999.1 polysaccharide biosynthesis protein [Bacteroides fluxus YIT 12057]